MEVRYRDVAGLSREEFTDSSQAVLLRQEVKHSKIILLQTARKGIFTERGGATAEKRVRKITERRGQDVRRQEKKICESEYSRNRR